MSSTKITQLFLTSNLLYISAFRYMLLLPKSIMNNVSIVATIVCFMPYISSALALIPSAHVYKRSSRSVHHNFSKHLHTSLLASGNDYTTEEDIIIRPINTIHNDKHNDNEISRRRNFLVGLTATSSILLSNIQTANAANANNNNDKLPWNPLNLKGTYWETGSMIYTKPNISSLENGDFLSILETTIISLSSSELLDSISEGKYSTTLRLIRGRLISETQIRLASNALLDLLPEDDASVYKSQESFRLFLRYLDLLDAEVEMASRLQLGGNSGLGDDPRIEILTRVGETEDALKVFVKNIKDGLRE